MRQIVLDTETTGLEWKNNNRIVEIGAVELIDRRCTDRTFHVYLNPSREFEAGSQSVTGLTLEFLADKPKFADIVDEFLDFVRGAELIIHNASFDIGFLNYELQLLGDKYGTMADYCTVLDTLALARRQYPNQRNSLTALCKRLKVDDSQRQLHGALLDAQILVQVYDALISVQKEISFAAPSIAKTPTKLASKKKAQTRRPVVTATPEELQLHQRSLAQLKEKAGQVIWSLYQS